MGHARNVETHDASRASVEIVEVGPRDGLQNEPEVLATSVKSQLIAALIDAGARRIEVASFVRRERVPQMADAEAVVEALPDRRDVSYIGLCLNKHGVLRALATRHGNRRGVDEVGCVVSATDAFGKRNQGQTTVEGLAETAEMIRLAKDAGLVAQVTISVAFGCPFEGIVDAVHVTQLVSQLAALCPMEIALADTIGVAVPNQVYDLCVRARQVLPSSIRLRAHFHNTRGTGIANAWAAYSAGVRTLDASVGGLGGCPFAPKAGGNIATEDLLYLLHRSGITTGFHLDSVIAASHWVQDVIGRPLPALVSRAGAFPAGCRR
jgi:hydroxymethylglutaryl-CoA lyase